MCLIIVIGLLLLNFIELLFDEIHTLFSIIQVIKFSSTKVAQYFQLFTFQSFFFSLTGTRNTSHDAPEVFLFISQVFATATQRQ